MISGNPSTLTLQTMTAGILYNPVPLDRAALANFYAQASAPFEFTRFDLIPDGGVLTVGNDNLVVQANRAQVNMGLAAPFEAVRQRAVAQFDAVRQFLRLTQYGGIGVKLLGFYSLGEPDASYLEHRLMRTDAPLDRLGLGRVGTGFRFNFQRDGVWDVKLEPFFRDLTQIYVEVDAHHNEPFTDLREADAWMETVERYCRREVVDFLQNLPA